MILKLKERRKEAEVLIDKNELYDLIKKAVREVLEDETLELFLKNIPSVSTEEMEYIKKLYGKLRRAHKHDEHRS